MAYADDGQGIKLKESSALFHEDSESWFQQRSFRCRKGG